MNTMSHPRAWLFAAASTLPMAAPAAATPQEPAAAPAVDRLQHPPGTVTAEAGIAQVERRGSGPVPLLLLAGAPFGWHVWEDFMQRNEQRYTMFAVTPAGYAQTPPPPMPPDEQADFERGAWTEPLMDDLVELIESEVASALGPPVVVAHHLMSDYYAVRLAHEHPDLVRGLVVVAGLGSGPSPADRRDREARAAYVRESRAPFFRTVSQQTWNQNTFPASALSADRARGQALFDAQVAVPIATQLRYYLEYMTDDVESHLKHVRAPILALEPPRRAPSLDSLPESMREQLVKRFGSLEAAREKVQMASSPWATFARLVPEGRMQTKEVAGTGSFVMQDAPAAFDEALAAFVAALPAPAEAATPPDGAPAGGREQRKL